MRNVVVIVMLAALLVPQRAVASDMCALVLWVSMPIFTGLALVSVITTWLIGALPPRMAVVLQGQVALGAVLTLLVSGSTGVSTHTDLLLYTWAAFGVVLALALGGGARAVQRARLDA